MANIRQAENEMIKSNKCLASGELYRSANAAMCAFDISRSSRSRKAKGIIDRASNRIIYAMEMAKTNDDRQRIGRMVADVKYWINRNEK